jgi:hypothetical protein
MMSKMSIILRNWLPLAVLAVGLCALVYAAVQLNFRSSLNDPQIQMAQDAADVLEQGAPAASLLPSVKVDITLSLAPFMTIYADDGSVLATSGVLNGKTPPLPDGVLDYVRTHGENRVSLEPEPGVRIAAVIVRVNGAQPGFVLVGRSMREVEARIAQLGFLVLAMLLGILSATLIVVGFFELTTGKRI